LFVEGTKALISGIVLHTWSLVVAVRLSWQFGQTRNKGSEQLGSVQVVEIEFFGVVAGIGLTVVLTLLCCPRDEVLCDSLKAGDGGEGGMALIAVTVCRIRVERVGVLNVRVLVMVAVNVCGGVVDTISVEVSVEVRRATLVETASDETAKG
jgi:hypothetical protein